MAVLTARGFRGAGGGRVSYVEAPPEFRGTSRQVCGLWPFAVGGGSPAIGTPIGPHLITHRTVNFDPPNWFRRAKLLHNPSSFTLGLPALGKSTLMRRLCIGLAGQGVTPLVLGDLKPDYVAVVGALGGQVIRLGRGAGALNVLEVGAMDAAADRIGGEAGESLRAEAHGRRLNTVKGLVSIVRGTPTRDYEDTVLSAGLRLLAASWRGTPGSPLLADLVTLLEQAPPQIRVVTLDRGDDGRYRDVVDPLMRSLYALMDGPLGSMFARPTTQRLSLSAPAVCIDVSTISANDTQLQAAALLACWSEGFAAVEAANALADAGREPQRNFWIVLDELWRVLRSGQGLVDRVDEVTRLNRNEGVAQGMITHSIADLRALGSQVDQEKARGFVERSGAVICGGLPAQELRDLADVVPFTAAERDLITSWATPPGWSELAQPAGLGNFLIKVGQRPGIPVHVDLTSAELDGFNNTNARWTMR